MNQFFIASRRHNIDDMVSFLTGDALERYNEKISAINMVDPYKVKVNDTDLPKNVTFPKIVQYMVFDISPFTNEPRNSKKGIAAVKYFESGWVKSVKGVKVHDNYVVHGRVSIYMFILYNIIKHSYIIQ